MVNQAPTRSICTEVGCDRSVHGYDLCLMHYKRLRTLLRRGPEVAVDDRLLASLQETAGGCWEWTGARDSDGYGTLWAVVHGVRLQRAHRVSWSLVNGPIPTGHFIRHQCDNPPCCNPDHLESGLPAANVNDMVSRQRQARGSRLPQTKLSVADVAAIRRQYAVVTQGGRRVSNAAHLAERYGVSADYVKHLVTGRGRKAVAA